jgi:8-oxo-dGTP pyrophosphatase MutT (NUDIX family)
VLLIKRHDRIAFMGGAHVFPGGSVDDEDRRRQPQAKDGVPPGHHAAAVRELQEEVGIRISPDALTPLAHWITPDIEVKRFDAWFFLATVAADQQAVHDAAEAVDWLWVDPSEAIARDDRGEIALPPPTWVLLSLLQRFDSADAAVEWARGRAIAAVRPTVVDNDGVRRLTAVEEREWGFTFERGRWRPER